MRKGMIAQENLGYFILAIIIAVILLGFVKNGGDAAREQEEGKRCEASVLRNARYHIGSFELGPEIDCPTKNLVLEKESGEQAKKKLADAMYTCWRQFGQGKLNLFSGEGVYCNVCYTIDLKTKEPVTGFVDYLMTTPSPEEDMYYYDYLSSFATPQAENVLKRASIDKDVEQELRKSRENFLQTNQQYAIIFVYAKGQEQFNKIVGQLTAQSEAGMVITGIAVGSGLFSGATVGASAAILVATSPVSVPAVVIAGGATAVGLGVYAGVQYVGEKFNPDEPPEWMAFNVLTEWKKGVLEEYGCRELVEAESN